MSRALRSELRIGFGVLLGLLLLVGLLGTVAVGVATDGVEEATQRLSPAQQANDAALQALTDAESGVRGYALSGEAGFLAPYRAAEARLTTARAALQESLEGDARGLRLMRQQERAAEAWFDGYARPRVARGTAGFDPALFQRGRFLFEDFRGSNGRLGSHIDDRRTGLAAEAERTRGWSIFAVLLVTVAGIGVGAWVSRSTSARVLAPMRELRDVLAALAAGDHARRVVPAGPREVNKIGRSVNELADENDRLRAVEQQERQQQAAQLRFARVSRSTLEPDELVSRCLQELGETLRLDRAYVRFVEDGEMLPVRQEWSAPGVEPLPEDVRRLSPGTTSLLQQMRWDEEVFVQSRFLESDHYRQYERARVWARATGARAFVTVALKVGEQTAGAITLISCTEREWTTFETGLAETFAADLGRALEQVRLFAAEATANERLRSLDQAKTEFVSSVSHELRTPLTSISGYLELLEDDDASLDPMQQKAIVVARRNVERLKLLIEDLLTLSRIESGAFRSTLTNVDLTAVVRAVVEDMTPQARQRSITLLSDVPEGEVIVNGDTGQLSRGLLNLVSNAVKFTPAEGEVCVRLHAERARQVSVSVDDTGIGIPAADQQALFTRFFRASNAISAGLPGTGLGLVIVRTIAENHGGELSIDSVEGRGTTVTLQLPLSEHGPSREAHPTASR